jgi:RNA polymerase sigma-70 factor (ECF subfamily)
MGHAHDDLRSELARLLPRLRRFGFALAGNMGDADDLTQAAIERVLTKADQWVAGSRLDSWMYRIMQNLWIDRRRSAAARYEVGGEDAAVAAPGVGERETLARIQLRQTRDCIARLPEEQRAVLILVGVEGMSYRETAETLHIPQGTVMSRLSRARNALIQMLEERPEAMSMEGQKP